MGLWIAMQLPRSPAENLEKEKTEHEGYHADEADPMWARQAGNGRKPPAPESWMLL